MCPRTIVVGGPRKRPRASARAITSRSLPDRRLLFLVVVRIDDDCYINISSLCRAESAGAIRSAFISCETPDRLRGKPAVALDHPVPNACRGPNSKSVIVWPAATLRATARQIASRFPFCVLFDRE